jgi:hypothetical protein
LQRSLLSPTKSFASLWMYHPRSSKSFSAAFFRPGCPCELQCNPGFAIFRRPCLYLNVDLIPIPSGTRSNDPCSVQSHPLLHCSCTTRSVPMAFCYYQRVVLAIPGQSPFCHISKTSFAQKRGLDANSFGKTLQRSLLSPTKSFASLWMYHPRSSKSLYAAFFPSWLPLRAPVQSGVRTV